MALLDSPLNWNDQTLEKLWSTLIVAYSSELKAKDLADMVGLTPGTFPIGSNMREIWKGLVEVLAAQGRLRALIERARDDPVVTQFRVVFTDALILHDNPIDRAVNEQLFMDDTVLLVDRTPLRERLKQLEPDVKPMKVLLVRGESKSGKSHGQYLFDHVARQRGAQSVYLDGAIAPTVDHVIAHLFTALGASGEIPPRRTTDNAYYLTVCNKLKEVSMNKNRPLWIAMDDLGVDADDVPLVDAEIKSFFDQFVLMTRSPDFRPWFRLMLINYPDKPVPTQWKRENWIEDRTSRADVNQDSVFTFLKGWLTARSLVMIDADVERHSQEVIAQGDAAADETTRLQIIHDALLAKLENIIRPTP